MTSYGKSNCWHWKPNGMETLRSHGSDKWKWKAQQNPQLCRRQPGRAEKCDNGCKPAIVAWPPSSKKILLNPQSLPNRARASNSKVAILFFKRKNGGVEHDKVPERLFASEVKCCCCTLCLILPHIIHFDMSHVGTCQQERCVRLHRDKLSSRGRSVGSW